MIPMGAIRFRPGDWTPRWQAEAPLASKFAFCFKKIMAARRISSQKVQEIIKAYEQTGSIALSARQAGVSEPTASDYLVSLGYHQRRKQVLAPDGMKFCHTCKQFLAESNFSARGKGKDAWCKSCNNIRNRPHALKHTLNRLGITSAEYDHLLEQQQGRCAICGSEEGHISKSGSQARLSVDHDHLTEQVRGLLCNKCNRGLGYFCESTELLSKALHYLLEAERKR